MKPLQTKLKILHIMAMCVCVCVCVKRVINKVVKWWKVTAAHVRGAERLGARDDGEFPHDSEMT
jgi:hypothetical protein